YVWDGRRRDGSAARPGTYTIHVRSTDLAKNRSQFIAMVPLIVDRDTYAPRIKAVKVYRSGAGSKRIRVNLYEKGGPFATVTLRRGSKVLARSSGKRSATLTFKRRLVSQLRNMRIVVVDTSGNRSAAPLRDYL